MTVRSFCNADLPYLVRLWNEHWSAIGPDPMINMARLEQAILARTFFDPGSLLVAESADTQTAQIEGWCLYYPDPHCPSTTVVGALCIGRQSDDSVATALLQEVETRSTVGITEQLLVGTIRDHVFGLAGLSPVGYGIGISNQDVRTIRATERLGYQKFQFAQRVTATASHYRPPINREAMQLRRTAEIQIAKYVHADSRSSASLCHLDIETHRLIDQSRNELARLNLWFSDPEAEVMYPTMVILDLETSDAAKQLTSAECYLIGEAAKSLTSKGIATIETVIDPTAEGILGRWRTLQFAAGDEGASWQKTLSV